MSVFQRILYITVLYYLRSRKLLITGTKREKKCNGHFEVVLTRQHGVESGITKTQQQSIHEIPAKISNNREMRISLSNSVRHCHEIQNSLNSYQHYNPTRDVGRTLEKLL